MLNNKLVTWSILCTLLFTSLTSCMSYDFSKRTVKQGNLISSAKLSRLHIGMSKEDVAILMGDSLLGATFNAQRWDYAYTRRQGSGPLLIKRVSLDFKDN